MSQATFDEDDLFDEAADDIRAEVDAHLDAARAELPDPEAVWTVEAENTLGVLNSLRSALDAGDAATHLRDAKKSYAMGRRAEVFEDDGDVAERIADLDAVVADIDAAHEHASDLASTVPELRGTLDDADATTDEDDATAAATEGEAAAE